ncbi:MAG: hypothetical protein ABJA18_09720 [bacterium]
MQTRTQYMLFLTIWAGAMVAALIVAMAYGFDVGGKNFRGFLVLCGLIGLVPAAACYFLVLRCGSLIDRWSVKHGHDVYQERAYEDNAGFIHLNAVPEREKQEAVRIREIVSGMEPLLDDPRNDSDGC